PDVFDVVWIFDDRDQVFTAKRLDRVRALANRHPGFFNLDRFHVGSLPSRVVRALEGASRPLCLLSTLTAPERCGTARDRSCRCPPGTGPAVPPAASSRYNS